MRWHVAQMLPRLRWNTREQQQVYDILSDYLRDSSSLVKTFAMHALADLTRQAPSFVPLSCDDYWMSLRMAPPPCALVDENSSRIC